MESAYKKAKEGGYEGRVYAPLHGAELLDPKFWQALGKSLGWGNKRITQRGMRIYPPNKLSVELNRDTSIYYWHRFIDHIASGKSTDSFFEELINPHDTTL